MKTNDNGVQFGPYGAPDPATAVAATFEETEKVVRDFGATAAGLVTGVEMGPEAMTVIRDAMAADEGKPAFAPIDVTFSVIAAEGPDGRPGHAVLMNGPLDEEARRYLREQERRRPLAPERLRELQDGAIVYCEVRNDPFTRSVLFRDRGAFWVAGSAQPISDVDLTDEYLAVLRDEADLWVVS
jgi:hypothetical protein